MNLFNNLLARTTAQENVELPLLYRGASARARKIAARRAEEYARGIVTGGEQRTPKGSEPRFIAQRRNPGSRQQWAHHRIG